jgi:glycosyltransferase involved in cell wall biosynthesis
MRLSIIIPVYNVEQYIRQCLESVYTQNVPLDTYEVIIVNDGTPDGSMNVVDGFTNYNNMKIINQENKGLSIARNIGLQNASGDYVWFIDSDDWIERNILENMYLLFDKYNGDVYSTPMKYSNTGKDDISISNAIIIEGKNYLFTNLPYGASQRFILRRIFLMKYGLKFMPNVFHEDGEFNIRMLYAAKNVYVMRDSIYNYRVRKSGSIMSSWKKKNSEDLVYIHKSLKLFCMNYVNDFSDKSMFSIVIFSILYCSIFFARSNWNTLEFKQFYKTYKSYIKLETLHLFNFFTFKMKGIKFFVMLIFIFIAPVFGIRVAIGFSKLKNKVKNA